MTSLPDRLEHWPLDKLIPYSRNARTHTDAQIKQIADSIQAFGFNAPILVDGQSGIIAGHARLSAARKLKLLAVPVIVLDHLTEEEKRAYIIADNKLALNAGWDEGLLMQELKSLGDLDVSLTGFSAMELDLLFNEEEDTRADECGQIPEVVVTTPGDLWICGRHRLLCGDATSVQALDQLMGGKPASMVFTDPPYGMHLDTDFSGAKSNLRMLKTKGLPGGHKYAPVIGDEAIFNPAGIIEYFANCPEQFWWGADYYAESIPQRNAGSWVVWDKRLDEVADQMYGSVFETCWSKTRHRRQMARVKWAGVFGTEHEPGLNGKKRFHPTQKPVALVNWFFERWGNQGDTVADVFAGSGATLIACEKAGRNACLMEIDPGYCDVIVARWQAYAQGTAILESTGQTFAERAA